MKFLGLSLFLLMVASGCDIQRATVRPTLTPITIIEFVTASPNDPTSSPEWKEQTIVLYHTSLSIPENWILQETNLRDFYGETCADYTISNPEGTLWIFIRPICGAADGFYRQCDANTEVIQRSNGDHFIVRYLDILTEKIVYTQASIQAGPGSTETSMQCLDPPVFFSFGDRAAFIEYQSFGGDFFGSLPIIDRIILSIR